MLIAFSSAFISCSNDSEMTNNDTNAKSSSADLNKQPATGPVVNAAAPSITSHKLIFQNNTAYRMGIIKIDAKGKAPGNCYISYSTLPGPDIYVNGMSTVTYVDFTTTIPSSYNIPTWKIDCGSGAPIFDTAANTLANYGLSDPLAAASYKYTYWLGASVGIDNGGVSGTYLGRNGVQFFQFPSIHIRLTFEVQSNGDCLIAANYY